MEEIKNEVVENIEETTEVIEETGVDLKKVGLIAAGLITLGVVGKKLGPKAVGKFKQWRADRKEAKQILKEVENGDYSHYEKDSDEELEDEE